MLLPSVYRAKNEETRVARIAVSAGKKDGSDVAQAKAGLAADADLLSKLTNPSASITASEAIKMIASVRGVSKITSFSIDTHDPHMISASIQGNAPSRDELLALKGRLMQVTPGGSVDFPISELTSNTDIDFSISIKWPIK